MTDPRTITLIGRDHPRTVLASRIDRTLASHGGLVFITGEAGIGKTALVADAMAAAENGGATVASGTSWDREGAPGYWPWIQVLRGLQRATPGDVWAEALATAGNEPAVLLGNGPDAGGPPPGIDASFGLSDAVTTLLAALSRHRPLVVVLDDLHWADAPSVRLLEFVTRHAWFEQLLVIGTYRDVEVEAAAHPLRPLLVPLAAKATSVPLSGLTRDEVGSLLERTAGRRPSEDVVAEVHRRTGGNPFFVDQTARLWQSTRSLDTVAPGIRDAVQRRLSLLSSELRDLLATAAVLGPEPHRDLLAAAMAPRVSPATVDRLLAEAATAGLLVPGDNGTWAFVHDLVRETLYDDLDRDTARRRHAAVARAFAADPELLRHSNPGVRAHHAASAVPEVPAEEAVDLLRQAARVASNRMAVDEANAYLRRAWHLTPADRLRERMTLAWELGDTESHIGEAGRGRDRFLDAAELARQLDDPLAIARAALKLRGVVWLVYPDGMDRVVADLVDEAHAHLVGDDRAAGTDVERPTSLHPDDADALRRELELSTRAVELAREAGDDDALLTGLLARCDALWLPGCAAEREVVADEISAVARRTGDRMTGLFASALRMMTSLERGRPVWLDEMTHLQATASTMNTAFARAIELWFQSMAAGVSGRFDDARTYMDESARIDAQVAGGQSGPDDLQALRLQQAWHINLLQGRYDRAEQLVRSAPEVGYPYPDLLAQLTALRRHTGEATVDEARRYLDKATSGSKRLSQWMVPLRIRLQAEVAAASGDPDLCDRTQAELAPIIDQWVIMLGDAPHGPVVYWSALIDAARGRLDAAVDGFTRARDAAARIGARPWVVEAGSRLADVLLRRGGADDGATAAVLLGEVEREATELGLRPVIDRARALRDDPVRPVPAAPRGSPERPAAAASDAPVADNTFRFDGQVWVLGYDGRTVHLPDAKGLRDLHTLLTRPGVEVPAVDLVHPDGDASARVAQRLGGDPVLDEEAKAAYRKRLARLDDEIERALARGNDTRAAALDEERSALLDELRRATGLGGRSRRLGDQAERARKAVSERIRDTLRKLDRAHPTLAEHLRASVSTGAVCRYLPAATTPWRLG